MGSSINLLMLLIVKMKLSEDIFSIDIFNWGGAYLLFLGGSCAAILWLAVTIIIKLLELAKK